MQGVNHHAKFFACKIYLPLLFSFNKKRIIMLVGHRVTYNALCLPTEAHVHSFSYQNKKKKIKKVANSDCFKSLTIYGTGFLTPFLRFKITPCV